MRWKVMKAFGLPPTSPLIQQMNEYQWAYCIVNLSKDIEEEDELFRMRAKYNGLFINPDAVKSITEVENKQKNKIKNNTNADYEHQKIIDDGGIDASDAFMRELNAALNDEQFFEMPNENDIRGDASMSSEDFIAMCQAEFEATEEEEKQRKIEQAQQEDLDLIIIDDD